MASGEKGREVYLEFVVQGGLMKVSAIDPVTGTEASVFGPATASRAALQRNALAKLRYVLTKKTRSSR